MNKNQKKKKEVAGFVRDWYDDGIPDYFKNKDGQVIDNFGEPQSEFRIFDNTNIQPGIYRKYKFLYDHGNLQETHSIETSYN